MDSFERVQKEVQINDKKQKKHYYSSSTFSMPIVIEVLDGLRRIPAVLEGQNVAVENHCLPLAFHSLQPSCHQGQGACCIPGGGGGE